MCVTKFTIYYELFVVIILMIGRISNSIQINNNKDSVYINNITKNYDVIPEVRSRYKRQTNINGKNCEIPSNSLHTTYKILGQSETSYRPGNFAKEFSVLEILCEKGYALSPFASRKTICENGKWSEAPQVCSRTCPSLKSTETTTVKCTYNNIPLENCINPVTGTTAALSCKPFYEEPNIQRNPVRVCKENRWNPPIAHCYPICGIKHPEGVANIINGQNATIGDYPWHIGIYNSTTKEFLCGGSIIDENIILTAAHCVTHYNGTVQPVTNYLVAAGKYFRKYDDSRDQFAQYSNILAIHVNERYKGIINMFDFDIAILILSSPFTLSEALKPVCIELNEVSQLVHISPYDVGVVTGWGYTQEGSQLSEVLKELEIPYIPFNKCFYEIPSTFRRYFTHDKICGGYKNNATSICGGDSGGALVFKNLFGDRYFVKGIVSTSPATLEATCDSNQYSLFTYVKDHINFVRNVMVLNQLFRVPLDCASDNCTNEENPEEVNANTNRHECDSDAECGPEYACIEFKCQNPCTQCGINAECDTVQNHIPVCKCPRNYYGNALTSCQPECVHNSDCPQTMCDGHICGQNAHCTTISGRQVCSCLKGYIGNPLSICNRAGCFDNSECRSHLSCVNKRCIDPCVGVCGTNANCKTRNHIPVCSCLAGYTGNPFTYCRRIATSELCHPSPCGLNTQCEVNGKTPVCKCLPGYHGSPLAGCRDECDSDAECGPEYACIEFKCQNPCAQCGINAECDTVQNHIPVCKCPRNYYGNPLGSCQPECVHNSDCPQTMCDGHICGQNAHCTTISGRPVCSCLKGYIGDPLSICNRAECFDDSECRSHLSCVSKRCIDPCVGVCGKNSNCETRNHIPVCSCPAGYTGNPFTSCSRFNSSELCHPSPCGQNTQCEVNGETPVCKCLPGYHGSPLAGCRDECDSDAECGSEYACIEFKCQNPCAQCGINAECNIVQNHIPVCKCPRNYYGNPLSSCQPECVHNSDCPPGKPACFYNACKNPCEGVCGTNANCELKNGFTPVCSCSQDMTGNPFESCRPFTKEDLCEPNPCGANAQCQPGYDKRNSLRPVCTCLPGFSGDPLTGCFKEACVQNSDCPLEKPLCSDAICKNPCKGVCGTNAICELRNRFTPVCSCPKNMTGDPFVSCRPFTKTDLCEPNPCGANAQCQPGYDKRNALRPVCTCLPGFSGDSLTGCFKACVQNSDCPLEKPLCSDAICKNPCKGACGTNAICELRNHFTPVCSCPKDMTGNPFILCRP